MLELPHDFTHQPPEEGYWYSVESFKRNMVSIWLHHPDRFVYTADPVRTIWGFYDTKKKVYCAPINSKKSGDVVDISDTRPWTAMQINYQGLERFFV